MGEYVKFRFTSEHGKTLGLVLALAIYRERSITELSRMFPNREASKMHRLECSDVFGTFEDAMQHDFEKE